MSIGWVVEWVVPVHFVMPSMPATTLVVCLVVVAQIRPIVEPIVVGLLVFVVGWLRFVVDLLTLVG